MKEVPVLVFKTAGLCTSLYRCVINPVYRQLQTQYCILLLCSESLKVGEGKGRERGRRDIYVGLWNCVMQLTHQGHAQNFYEHTILNFLTMCYVLLPKQLFFYKPTSSLQYPSLSSAPARHSSSSCFLYHSPPSNYLRKLHGNVQNFQVKYILFSHFHTVTHKSSISL